jgi:hypothetical protein
MQSVALATKTPDPESVLHLQSGGPVFGSAGVQAGQPPSEVVRRSFLALVQAQAESASPDPEGSEEEMLPLESGGGGPRAKDSRREAESGSRPTPGLRVLVEVASADPGVPPGAGPEVTSEVAPEVTPEVDVETRPARAPTAAPRTLVAQQGIASLDSFAIGEFLEVDIEPDSIHVPKQYGSGDRAASSRRPTGGSEPSQGRVREPEPPKAAAPSEAPAVSQTQADAIPQESELNVRPNREQTSLFAEAPPLATKVHIAIRPEANSQDPIESSKTTTSDSKLTDTKSLKRQIVDLQKPAFTGPKTHSGPHSNTRPRSGNPVENVPSPPENSENPPPNHPQSGNPVEKPQPEGFTPPAQTKPRVAARVETPAPDPESLDPRPSPSPRSVPVDSVSPVSRPTPSGKAETEVRKAATTAARTSYRQPEGQDMVRETTSHSRHVLHDEQSLNPLKYSGLSDIVFAPSTMNEGPQKTSEAAPRHLVQPLRRSAINDARPSSGSTEKRSSGEALQDVRTAALPGKPAETPNLEVYRLHLDPDPSAAKHPSGAFETPTLASVAQVIAAASPARPRVTAHTRSNPKEKVAAGLGQPATHSERATKASPALPETRSFTPTIAVNDADIEHSVSDRDAATKARAADRSVPSREPTPSEVPAAEQEAPAPAEKLDQAPLRLAGTEGLPDAIRQGPLSPLGRRTSVESPNQEAIPVARTTSHGGSPSLTGSLSTPSRISVPTESASYGSEPARARPASVEAALLEKTPEQQALQLQVRDEKLGRVVIRLTERAGLIDAMVRTDGVRSRELLGQQLPLLVESLVRRGFETRYEGFSHNPNSREGSDQHDPPRRREQHARRRRPDQKARPAFRVRLN